MKDEFSFSQTPKIDFGIGVRTRIADRILEFGNSALLVTGGAALLHSGWWDVMQRELAKAGIATRKETIQGEPSPARVDEIVSAHRDWAPAVVVGIGGGSAMDAGKAVSAMLPSGEPVRDFLEGVGTGKRHTGTKAPFIAVPTTAGTGSEATKNAVLSEIGPQGFKKSLRHDRFVPDVAVIDPELSAGCPHDVTAACGMDAFTQLLESYVSTNASPMTDALAWSGIERLSRSLLRVSTDAPDDLGARADVAYGALLSGITLANAGLGIVHGVASPLGGRFPIPHGVACGTLLAPATRVNIVRLMEREDAHHPALIKFARVGRLIAGEKHLSVEEACKLLPGILEGWTRRLRIPSLGAYGVREEDLAGIADQTVSRTNPIPLTQADIVEICQSRIHLEE